MKRQSLFPLTIVHLRRQRGENILHGSQQRTRWITLGFGISISIAIAILFLGVAFTYSSITRSLPSVEEIAAQLNLSNGTLLTPTQLFDRTGQHLLATLSPSNDKRVFIAYDQFPKPFIDATLALAQPDFWTSPGFVIAGWQDADAHPTLAQRLVHDFLLMGGSSPAHQGVQERLLAAHVTARYGREQVLEWVLNSTDYGHFAFGAESAAQLYLGKSITGLNLSEAALLAAVGNAPALNPFDAPQAAETGRIETIQQLLSLGWITPPEADGALWVKPVIAAGNTDIKANGVSEEFVDLLLHQLDTTVSTGYAKHGGVIVHTSLDYDLQLQADCILQTQLAHATGNTEIIAAIDGSPCKGAEYLPADQAEESIQGASAGVVILDPSSGQILAAAGNLQPQPAGTAISPFIYLTGFARGLNPATLGWDLPADQAVPGQVYQGPVRLRIALANDYLPPLQAILAQLGMHSVVSTTESLGLDLPTTNLLQTDFALSPFDLAFSYATLATQGRQFGQNLSNAGISANPFLAVPEGKHLVPATILKVYRADGSLLMDWSTPLSRLVVSPQLAYLLNHILSDETARSSSLAQPNLHEIGRPVAIKASHTLSNEGSWITGYTPQRVIAIYTAGAGDGSGFLAQELWSALAQYSLRDLPVSGWEMPPGIVTLNVCDPSGLLPTEACPHIASEVFLEDRIPLEADNLYQLFEINIETGLLATVFTPTSLIRKQVFMVVPPEAQSWSEIAGIVPPPSTYDMYRVPDPVPGVQITDPIMFSNTHGKLDVRGSAAGAEFVSYRIEYGAGLNPKQWILLGDDKTTPVVDGLLASWDTSGLNGVFTLRLLVLQKENRVEQAFVQVTLDNTAPEITIQYPLGSEVISLSQQPQIVLQAQVEEAFLGEVVFYMDGEKMVSLAAPPFGVIWDTVVGNHVLRVTATDLAGNSTEIQTQFTVNK